MRYALTLALLFSLSFARVYVESNYPLRNNNFLQNVNEENMFVVLWALQRLKDVRDIKISSVGRDTVIYVDRHPILKEVSIKGNLFADDKEIKNLLLLREGEPLIDFVPEVAKNTLKLFYRRKGFLDTEVDISLEVDDKGLAYVEISVDEGELYFLGDIRFVGLKSFPPSKLLYRAGLRLGSVFNEDTVRKGVRKIQNFYREEGFLESSVYLEGIEKKKTEGAFLRVLLPGAEGTRYSFRELLVLLFGGFSNLTSHPIATLKAITGRGYIAVPVYVIREGERYLFKFEGNANISDDELLNLIEQDTPGVDIFFLENTRKAIEEYYRSKGFFDVRVNYSFEEGEIIFHIEEGDRYKLRVLGFKGLKLPDKYDRELINEVVEQLRERLRSEGYLTARIELLEEVNTQSKVVYLVLKLTKGKRVILSSLSYVGKDEKLKALFSKYSVLTPTVFKEEIIEDLNRNIDELLKREGYLDGEFSVHIEVEESEDSVALGYIYTVQKGKRYKYGSLLIYGNEKTRAREIYFTVVKEKFFSSQAEEESLWNLIQSENFTGVRIENLIDREEKVVHRLVEVREDRRGLFELSAGYNTEEKFKVEGGVKLKNLFGVGIILKLSASKSQKYETYFAGLSDKFFFSRKYFTDLSLFRKLEFHNSFDLESRGFLLSFGYRPNRWVSISTFVSKTNNIVDGFGSGRFSLLKYGFFIMRETRDDPINPSNLTHNSIRLTKTQGDRNYYKIEVNNFFLRELVRGLSANFRLAGGWSGKEAPIFDRYFLGGLKDMKGYDFEGIGYPAGGRTYVFTRAELIFEVRNPLWLGVYTDAGGVGDSFEETRRALKYDVGTAVGVNTPAGFVRLDIAKPVDRLSKPLSSIRVYLSIGYVY